MKSDLKKYFAKDKTFTSSLVRNEDIRYPTISFCDRKRLKFDHLKEKEIDPNLFLFPEDVNLTNLNDFSVEEWNDIWNRTAFKIDDILSSVFFYPGGGQKKIGFLPKLQVFSYFVFVFVML